MNALKLTAKTGLRRQLQKGTRRFNTAAQRQDLFAFNKGDKQSWKDPATYPIIVITTGAVTFGCYKLLWVDVNNPETTFGKHERGTLNYLENNKSDERARSWANSPMHQGPKGQWRVGSEAAPRTILPVKGLATSS
uniref:Uncharacterized protein n=1 Tax=Aplanochytrium stocchinoi TaxID=215587 RepID=A0A7S3PN61_9STRA|mmetsp:Transcript_14494/g.17916  ORF Transcript_14494/g.17916 Transcript_14494/m.17916 type:complete len:136 (+) Transcript_14494:311-718(+)|eukprot:CAMPEP_0204829016 /NCGR_PEP_ID=MMETSP1346-20131115/6995_1 /ASSEMBLY_ACC=CAM_ASM_000771 /TAXON_ID=215587 /ORGANISM="Aplanochytrium stocchinoi, Strain GSBS06" /LENGTH=135 /DNA_ID=CAMNT_0051958469 /DNA_START=214 /DNA_END=621 /DNA_ORIENTATION=-